MSVCVALLRGINVGRAKRIPMAELRALLEGLGHRRVRTLLNSGNVVFDCARPNVAILAQKLEAAIVERFGFTAAVTVLAAAEFEHIVEENPFEKVALDHSRFLIAFVAKRASLVPLRAMAAESWLPDAMQVTSRAVYLWCSTGVLDGKLVKAFSRQAKSTVTTRNWATVLKLQALIRAE